MPYVQEVDAQVKELRQNIANLNNKQMSLRTDLKKLKEKTVEMDDKVSLLSDGIIETQQVSMMSYIISLDIEVFEQYIEQISLEAQKST